MRTHSSNHSSDMLLIFSADKTKSETFRILWSFNLTPRCRVCKSKCEHNYYYCYCCCCLSVYLLMHNKQSLIDAWAPEPINNPRFLTVLCVYLLAMAVNCHFTVRASLASLMWVFEKAPDVVVWMNWIRIYSNELCFLLTDEHRRYGTNFHIVDHQRTHAHSSIKPKRKEILCAVRSRACRAQTTIGIYGIQCLFFLLVGRARAGYCFRDETKQHPHLGPLFKIIWA